MEKCYYHICANGDDAKNFIICERDAKAAFNRMAICAYRTGAIVIAFSIEDSHIHVLVYGTYDKCLAFKLLYESMTKHFIAATRGNLDGVLFDCELIPVDSEDYLKTAAAYVAIQPTKDGKRVMPYDYLLGTGTLYFRSSNTIPIWLVGDDMTITKPVMMRELTARKKREITCSSFEVPGEWLVANGYILPTNYVDIKRYEEIFQTYNSFRVFLGQTSKKSEEVLKKMISVRGITLEDYEARKICGDISYALFGKRDARWLNSNQRMTLAMKVRKTHKITFRQLSTIVRLPESELRKYIK
ncbi:MAG: hypothetical protein MJY56_04615 [Bacteroidales bacterium]|nr:hypothetical protein [Bacteroidales bacterium]